jgi:hypothetical protein
MRDYNLRAYTESELYEKLMEANIVEFYLDEQDSLNIRPDDADDTWQPTGKKVYYSKVGDLDVIGTIYRPTGNTLTSTDNTGATFEYSEQIAIEGFHANLRATLTPEQDECIKSISIETPKTPMRVWA